MILVIAGTKAAREITTGLKAAGRQVTAAVTTKYGEELLSGTGVKTYLLSAERSELIQVLRGITIVIDASHPHGAELSQQIAELCREQTIAYLRLERRETELPQNPLIHLAYSWEEAADMALVLGKVIFLTTGSYRLDTFINHSEARDKRIIVRVLPEHRVVKKCQDLGLPPKDIVAMQGPFSKRFNKAMYRALKAEVVVSKESGAEGGTDTKARAALELGLPLVILRRPPSKFPATVYSVEEALQAALKTY